MKHAWIIKALLFFIAYYVVAVAGYEFMAAHALNPPANLSTPVDEAIPFISWFAVPYVFLFYPFILGAVGYFSLVRPEKANRFFAALFGMYAVSYLTYFVFPVAMSRPDPSTLPGDFLSQVMANFYRSDPPLNCFPSLHAASSTLAAYFLSKEVRSKALKAFVWGVAASVILSTLFVRQHVIADEVAGFAVAYAVSYLAERKIGLGEAVGSYFRLRVAVTAVLVGVFSAFMIYPLLPI
ncbi:MAG: inositol phosphorylceramide synthase [Desulfurococcales archaeon]|nr:inositol phosphorylceramide synthase [Desulfurococcales archaeon]